MESVVVPFLRFCYGTPPSSSSSAPSSPSKGIAGTPSKSGDSAAKSPLMTLSSPVKKYGSMPPLCLDAVAQLLNCHDKGPNSRRLPPLNLCPNLFGEKARFAAHHADLFHVVAEASEHARGEQEVSLLKNIFTTIASSVCSILEVRANNLCQKLLRLTPQQLNLRVYSQITKETPVSSPSTTQRQIKITYAIIASHAISISGLV